MNETQTVYVLVIGAYADQVIHGVYATWEAATAALAQAATAGDYPSDMISAALVEAHGVQS